MIRILRGVGICALPVLVALWVGATTFGGSLLPWRPVMVDLEVYREAARVLLAGGDFYDLPGELQFLYPPLAAVLAGKLPTRGAVTGIILSGGNVDPARFAEAMGGG